MGRKSHAAASLMWMLAGSCMSSMASAQTAQPSLAKGQAGAPPPGAADQSGLGEIVVTAQRRAESLQKTSIAVEVASGEALARAGVTQPSGLANVLPGVQISSVNSVLQIYIRGVGDFGSTATANPSVAFNIDGVYVARSQSSVSEFYDVDRVEALKGPQGTLYGRNASGGAVNLLTRKPKLGEFAVNVSGEYLNYRGTSMDGASIDGAINIPLGETLAARFSGTYVNKDGYTSEGFSDDKHEAARLKLLWQPSATTSLLLNGSYGHTGGIGGNFPVLVNKVPGLANQSPWLDATDPKVRAYLISTVSPLPRQTPGTLDPPTPEDGGQNLRFWNVSAEFNTDLGFATLTVLPAYRHADLDYHAVTLLRFQVGDGFGSVAPHPETSRETSVEVRLGKDTQNLKWVLGGYFFNEDQYSQYVNGDVLAQYTGRLYTLNSRSYAAFGQATYSISDRLRVIGGLRYTSDRHAIAGRTLALAPSFKCAGVSGVSCLLESYSGSSTSSNVSWKGGVEYDLTPASLFYATVSSGYKSGGFNPQISPLAPPGNTEAYGYKPETLTAYEAGLKSRFFNNRLQLNLEAFYWDYRNLQQARVAISGAGNTGLALDNAGKARMYGGSVELLARPWRGGTLSANLEYLNARYLSYTVNTPARTILPGLSGCPVTPSSLPAGSNGPISTIDCSGFEVVRAPKWSGSVGYTHRIGLGGGAAVEVGGILRFASSRWLATDFVAAERAPNYQTLDGSVSYIPAGERFTITGFVRNITNEVVYQGGFEGPFQPGTVIASIMPPRTYGVRFAFRFH